MNRRHPKPDRAITATTSPDFTSPYFKQSRSQLANGLTTRCFGSSDRSPAIFVDRVLGERDAKQFGLGAVICSRRSKPIAGPAFGVEPVRTAFGQFESDRTNSQQEGSPVPKRPVAWTQSRPRCYADSFVPRIRPTSTSGTSALKNVANPCRIWWSRTILTMMSVDFWITGSGTSSSFLAGAL